MKTKLLLLLFASILVAAPNEFNHKKKNAILVHPIFVVGIPFDYVLVELDYIHRFKNDITLLVKPQYYKGPSDLFQWDRKGRIWGASLEAGIRRPFYFAGNSRCRFGLFPQVTISGGYIYNYHKNTEQNIVLEDYEGYLASFNFAGGTVFEVKRFIITGDIGGKWNFYRPYDCPQILPTCNLAIGFTF